MREMRATASALNASGWRGPRTSSPHTLPLWLRRGDRTMKAVPKDAQCVECETRLHLHHCYECCEWFCWKCAPDDYCSDCAALRAAQVAAGIPSLARNPTLAIY